MIDEVTQIVQKLHLNDEKLALQTSRSSQLPCLVGSDELIVPYDKAHILELGYAATEKFKTALIFKSPKVGLGELVIKYGYRIGNVLTWFGETTLFYKDIVTQPKAGPYDRDALHKIMREWKYIEADDDLHVRIRRGALMIITIRRSGIVHRVQTDVAKKLSIEPIIARLAKFWSQDHVQLRICMFSHQLDIYRYEFHRFRHCRQAAQNNPLKEVFLKCRGTFELTRATLRRPDELPLPCLESPTTYFQTPAHRSFVLAVGAQYEYLYSVEQIEKLKKYQLKAVFIPLQPLQSDARPLAYFVAILDTTATELMPPTGEKVQLVLGSQIARRTGTFTVSSHNTSDGPRWKAVRLDTPPELHRLGGTVFYAEAPKKQACVQHYDAGDHSSFCLHGVKSVGYRENLSELISMALSEAEQNFETVTIHRHEFDINFNLQLKGVGAFTTLSGANQFTRAYSQWILDFQGQPWRHDYFKMFPLFERLRKRIQNDEYSNSGEDDSDDDNEQASLFLKAFLRLDREQQRGFLACEDLPFGDDIIIGVPGSGKTTLAHFKILLAMARPIIRAQARAVAIIKPEKTPNADPDPAFGYSDFVPRSPRVAYIVGTNQSGNDQLVRFAAEAKEFKMSPKLVRMNGWAAERRKLEEMDIAPRLPVNDGISSSNYPDAATTMSKIVDDMNARGKGMQRVHYGGEYSLASLCWQKILKDPLSYARLLEMQEDQDKDWDTQNDYRSCANMVMRSVLEESDAVFATPAAFNGLMDQRVVDFDIVHIDEGARMDEATVLSVLARCPKRLACIVTGDPDQLTVLLLSNGANKDRGPKQFINPFVQQMLVPMMQRHRDAGAKVIYLDTNWRALGGLHQFPSDMFYGSRMTSGHPAGYMPVATAHSVKVLRALAPASTGSRMLIDMAGQNETASGTSATNEANACLVAELVAFLHRAGVYSKPFQADGRPSERATIFVITPYRAQTNLHQQKCRLLLSPAEWCSSKVTFLTERGCQGLECDFAIIDLVRTGGVGHAGDDKVLCTLDTRVRSASIVITSSGLFKHTDLDKLTQPVKNIRTLYHKHQEAGAVIEQTGTDWLNLCRTCFTVHAAGKCIKTLVCQPCNDAGRDHHHHVRNCDLARQSPMVTTITVDQVPNPAELTSPFT